MPVTSIFNLTTALSNIFIDCLSVRYVRRVRNIVGKGTKTFALLPELFTEVVGVFVDPDLDVEDVTVRVYGKQRNFFEGTPLHHSQKLVNRTGEYSDYHFHLRPEYEFIHEILRLGKDAEVLSPQWVRDEICWHAEQSLKRYNEK